MTMEYQMILASASPRRRELLSRIGLAFTVKPACGEERGRGASAWEQVEELALQKAEEIAEEAGENVIVIGADTLVFLDGKPMGKPQDEKEAARMLSALQGRTHQVYTGVALIWSRGGEQRRRSFHECTDVTVYPMTQEEILAYIRTGEPMDKAGAYGIQGLFARHIQKIEGDYNNVVGLPVGRLYQEMKAEGIWINEKSGNF